MKTTRMIVAIVLGALLIPGAAQARRKQLLVVTHTTGFRHGDSIALGEKVMKSLADGTNWLAVDYARNAEDVKNKMTPAALARYDGVMFLNTTGDLGLPDRDAFLAWIRAGHAFIGTHSATDTYHDWKPYIDMIGGEFKTHGKQVEVEIHNEDPQHPAAAFVPKSFKVFDEIYEFKPESFSRSRSHVLLAMTQHPQTGVPGDYWVSWCRCEGNGRVFYTSLGHRTDVWATGWYQTQLLNGIRWSLGLVDGSCAPSAPATTPKP